MSFKKTLSIATLCAAAAVAGTAAAQDSKTVLTLATAKQMAEACEAKSKAEGWKMVIAIVDDGGNLKYYSRMDGSFLISVKIAQSKAETSARVPVSTRKLGEISQSVKGLELVPGVAIFAGGLPIFTAGGAHIGGIGVSGGSADQDEVCAQASLDAVKGVLK
ncbi:MAG: heme-binding protein [Burkholderiales bacterium]|nr:heme-binding protein [Burkholderiales bacterium]